MKRYLLPVVGSGALLALVLLAQTTTAPAQPTIAQQVAARVAQLTTLLDLTTPQQGLATTIFTKELTALSPLGA